MVDQPEIFFSVVTNKVGNHSQCALFAYPQGAKESAGSIQYRMDPENNRVYINSFFVEKEYRRQGIALALLAEVLMLTPATYYVDPMIFQSNEGRELWKKARRMSRRIIPATRIEKLNRERKGVVHVSGYEEAWYPKSKNLYSR